MLTPQDRDDRLHKLYKDRNLWIFLYGEEWFDKQAEKIHWDWEQSGTWLKVTDLDVTIAKVSWESTHKYI